MVDRLSNRTFNQPNESAHGYNETLMYGHYSSKALGLFARKEAANVRTKREIIPQRLELCDKCQISGFYWFHRIFNRKTQDWIFLTVLGFFIALFSFLIDIFVETCAEAHRWLYKQVNYSIVAQYFVWILFPIILISFSAGFTHVVGPSAIGSGIPEMKTILKGATLKEYLSWKTLVAKLVGLATSLGSGLPLGKMGPFVHVSGVTATLLSQLFPSLRNQQENKSLSIGILTAASAVGVSCIFATPIGGVLFSIEATATYYAIRNYWRGFYGAICGAISFRILASWFKQEESLTALFKTNLRQELPYDVLEILIFIIVGVICGALGALFVFSHKNIVLFIRRQKKLSAFLQKRRLIYPCFVTLVIFSVLFPDGLGKYFAGQLSLRDSVNQMFDNQTWVKMNPIDEKEARMLNVWKGPHDNVLLTLFLFLLMRFWMCAIATTLPVPCGIFIPAFSLGAAVGRLIGELMATWFPEGIRGKLILPGAYSIVGAATFSGAVSHTVSPAVIVFELTGYLGHILPCVIGVIVAGATANFLQPSAYDAMIQIKNLPFLPPNINVRACRAHIATAEDIMNRDVPSICPTNTFGEVLELMEDYELKSYPVVDSKDNMILLGTIQTKYLKELISRHRFYEVTKYNERPSITGDDYEIDEGNIQQKSDGIQESCADGGQLDMHEKLTNRRPSRFSNNKVNNDIEYKQSQKSLDTQETTEDKKNAEMTTQPRRPSRFSTTRVAAAEDLKQSRRSINTIESQEDRQLNFTRRPSRYSIARVVEDEQSQVSTTEIKEDKQYARRPSRVSFVKFVTDFIHSQTSIFTQETEDKIPDLNWQQKRLELTREFEDNLDPAPFQISSKTTLYKIQLLFSLLSLHHAIVTENGKFVGILSLDEVRQAILCDDNKIKKKTNDDLKRNERVLEGNHRKLL